MTLLILQRKPTPSRISLYLPMLPVRSHSFSDLVPMEPRSDLPPMTLEHPQYKYLECVSQLFQLQPIWDKRYLTLEVQHRFPDDDPSVVQSAVATVTPYTGYVLTDGPFRNSWLRFGYDPSHDPSSWVYQYVEFRFSKRPQLKEKGDDGRPLPILYEVELNLHNRYPVWVLRVGLKREDES